MAFQWNARLARYRNTSTGRFVPARTVRANLQRSITTSTNRSGEIARAISAGEVAPADARAIMRQEIKKAYIRAYELGRGGRQAMTYSDWGSVGGMLKEQYSYLDRFLGDIAEGNLSEGQIRTRFGMYLRSSREGYERGSSRATRMPPGILPAYPGDGQSECLTNCKCRWVIERVFAFGQFMGWNCTWTLGIAEHCRTCVNRAALWAPLFVPAGTDSPPPVDDEDLVFPFKMLGAPTGGWSSGNRKAGAPTVRQVISPRGAPHDA